MSQFKDLPPHDVLTPSYGGFHNEQLNISYNIAEKYIFLILYEKQYNNFMKRDKNRKRDKHYEKNH